MLFLTNSNEEENEWISTKSIYLINSSRTYVYQERIKIDMVKAKKDQKTHYRYKLLYSNNNYSTHKFYNNQEIDINAIYKCNSLYQTFYEISINNSANMEIYSKKIYKNIAYNEKMYKLNPNLIITFSKITKNHKYIAIIFTSYIKQAKSHLY